MFSSYKGRQILTMLQIVKDDDVDIREAMATSVSEALNLPVCHFTSIVIFDHTQTVSVKAFVQPERATELVYMRLLELVSGPSEAKELLEELQSLLIGDANLSKSIN